ncbi:MAG: PHP domain-containing protein [Planctomycetota bacterium]|nr:PHP domain-containing protein [Planctomycetota bacterium]
MVVRLRKVLQPDLVDLHVHSSVSDGLLSPRDLVRHAKEVGLKAMAITDHDTVAGVAEALEAGREFGIEVIAGVEISTEIEKGACHILGYFVDHTHRGLKKVLSDARGGRETRNVRILELLNKLGLHLTMDEMAARVQDGVLTRAHFATAMLEKGYVKKWDEAFERYLGAGKPAYVARARVMPADAIKVIHAAGGLAVLAHPRQLNRSPKETDARIEDLAAAGLDGVETQTPDHTVNYARRYRAAAKRLSLVETGGTDWHGYRPAAENETGRHINIHLGLGRGSMAIHYTLVEAMKARLAARKK